jgi:hypothetical protein
MEGRRAGRKSRMNTTLPHNLVINDVMHVAHYRQPDKIVYQNYSEPGGTGSVLFHLFQVLSPGHGETLGQKLGSYTFLHNAIDAAARST